MSVRTVERVTVTRIVNVEGQGVAPDPVREVTYWYQDDGTLISRDDPHAADRALAHRALADRLGSDSSPPSIAGVRGVY